MDVLLIKPLLLLLYYYYLIKTFIHLHVNIYIRLLFLLLAIRLILLSCVWQILWYETKNYYKIRKHLLSSSPFWISASRLLIWNHPVVRLSSQWKIVSNQMHRELSRDIFNYILLVSSIHDHDQITIYRPLQRINEFNNSLASAMYNVCRNSFMSIAC